MISSVSVYSTNQSIGTFVPKTISSSQISDTAPPAQSQTTSSTSSTSTLSVLSRQLSESANRADIRDKTLSRTALADKAKHVMDQIAGNTYQALKKIHDSEVPKTDDPALLARAKQATTFVNSDLKSVQNPFAGLSNEQLSNITYDESGTFTVNERQAAWIESYNREEAWREKVISKAIEEENQTGKLTNFYKAALEHFNGLPAIEQAQYPQNYASDLSLKISQDSDQRPNHIKDQDSLGLIDMLVSQVTKTEDIKLRKYDISDSSEREGNKTTST